MKSTYLAYGNNCSLKKFLESDPGEIIRLTQLPLDIINRALLCVSKTVYPLSQRQTTGVC